MSSTATTTVYPPFSAFTLTPPPTSSAPRSKSRRRFSRLPPGDCFSMDASSSLGRLSAELLTLVCEQLLDIDKKSLWGLRRVNRRLGAIATPLVLKTLTLSLRLIENWVPVMKLVERYTKHVVVTGYLPSQSVQRFLLRTGKLLTITWRFSSDDLEVAGTWLPSEVLDIEAMQRNGTKLIIEELPMRRFAGDSYIRAIPANLLTSLKLARPTPPLTTHLASLKSLLLQARNLEVLHYQDRGQGTQFAFQEGERLPAYRDLRLRSYDWDHSGDEVRQHWDFSKLETLVLDSAPYFNFLSSIDFRSFPNLQSLHIEDWSPHRPNKRKEATKLLGTWIKDHLKGLKSLKITCHIRHFPIEAVLAHADSLEVLQLRDHVGFREDNDSCPTLEPADVAALAKAMTWVRALVVDFDPEECDMSHFFQALLLFPHLGTLTIHTQSVAGRSKGQTRSPAREDVDYDIAMGYFSGLTQQRVRNNMEPLKVVTINMGDWKPIMVRRLGARWRALNERGIFAERCFVVRREDGEYKVEEEKGIVNSSPRATPDLWDYSDEEYDSDD